MSGLRQDLRYAIRALRRNPIFTTVATTTLALAIGANTAIFSVVRGAILEAWPYADADRIVTLRRSFPRLQQTRFVPFSVPEVLDVQSRTDVFERTLAGDSRNVNLTEGGRPERVHGGALTASVFGMLGVEPQLGRVFTEKEDVPGGPRVVVLSDRLWRARYAGDREIVGRTIEVEGQQYTVLGVMPRRFVFWDALLYFPLALDRRATDRQARSLVIQGRLAPGLTPERAAIALDTLARRWEREHPTDAPEYAGSHFRVELLKRGVLRDVQPALFVLAVAAGLALLIAAVNVANLLLSRAASRDREIAVRAALGAGRGRIVRLFLFEGLLLAVSGGALGLLGAAAAVPSLLSLIPYGYIPAEADVRLDVTVAAFTAGLGVLCGILLGLAPLLRLSSADPARSIREGSSRSIGDRRGRRARAAFVVVQVALALLVVSGSGLLLQSMRRLLAIPPGFTAEGVQTVRTALPTGGGAPRARAFLSETLRRIAGLPGMTACGAVTSLPLTGSPSRTLDLEGLSREEAGVVFEADQLAASPGYFETLRIPVESGRSFAAIDGSGSPLVAVVSQAFARRFFAGRDPIGRRVRFTAEPASGWMTVVGIVGDVRQADLEREPHPALYVPLDQADPMPPSVALAVRSLTSAGDSQAAVRGVVSSLDPNLPLFLAAPLTRIVSDSLGGRRLAALLLTAFAAVALALAVLGTTAVAAYSVGQRRREIAVRMALGAQEPDVTRLFLKEISVPVGLGVAFGAALSIAGTRWLSALLYGVSAGDPVTLGAATVLLSGLTLLASVVPARRASRIDPMVSLRSE
jgi:putative ABC transport system permease protein